MNAPSFRFRLERVRALRERKEELAREELASSLSLRLKGEAMLKAAQSQVDEARANYRETAVAGLASGEDFLAAQAYLERTERTRHAAELQLSRQEAEVDAHRSALTEAARDRKALERLKERQRTEHKRETERREGVALDELAATMHRRREQGA